MIKVLPPADERAGTLRGAVTSGNYGPVFEVAIGLGYSSPEPLHDGPVEPEMPGEWRNVKQIDDLPFPKT